MGLLTNVQNSIGIIVWVRRQLFLLFSMCHFGPYSLIYKLVQFFTLIAYNGDEQKHNCSPQTYSQTHVQKKWRLGGQTSGAPHYWEEGSRGKGGREVGQK